MLERGNGEKPSMLEYWDEWMGRTEVGGQRSGKDRGLKVELQDGRLDG